MKLKILSLIATFALFSMTSFAGNIKKEKIKVEGNCGMCEERIEKAAKSVDGVLKAIWYPEYEILEVKYDEEKTSSDEIQKAIASVGHSTEKFKADKKVYEALPACCKY